ncbi:40S ribosomal protein S3 [Tulasnella sp. 332]|nr:40S ribosomal protein S3 [Tulasnella sp. 332]
MQSAAKSYEVVVSGKLRAARAKSMKFMDVFMILSGQTAKDYVDYVVRRVLLRQGVLGLKVKIMKGWDPEERIGPRNPLPDTVTIFDPPVNKRISEPVSEQRGPTNVDPVAAPMAAEEEHAAPEETSPSPKQHGILVPKPPRDGLAEHRFYHSPAYPSFPRPFRRVAQDILLPAAHDAENGCMEALELLVPRQIFLSRLGLTMWTYSQDFLNRLPAVLNNQPLLTSASLPPCSATLQLVKALDQLPVLEEYLASFNEEHQNPVELLGRGVDWEKWAFPALRRLTLYTSLADASFLMAKPHQPRLHHLTLANRGAFHNSDVYALCSSLSTNQFNITTLYLFIYYDSKTRPQGDPFLSISSALCFNERTGRISSEVSSRDRI